MPQISLRMIQTMMMKKHLLTLNLTQTTKDKTS
jgi:hypothetical protein